MVIQVKKSDAKHMEKCFKNFYGETLRIAQKQGRPPTAEDAIENLKKIRAFICQVQIVSFLKQPIVDEWVSKGWKSITYKNWHFAVELVDEKNGIIVDCDTTQCTIP